MLDFDSRWEAQLLQQKFGLLKLSYFAVTVEFLLLHRQIGASGAVV